MSFCTPILSILLVILVEIGIIIIDSEIIQKIRDFIFRD
jgi:hypothetical protein